MFTSVNLISAAVAGLCFVPCFAAGVFAPPLTFEPGAAGHYVARAGAVSASIRPNGLRVVAGRSDAGIRIGFVGANTAAKAEHAAALPGRVNYYLGNDPSKWRTGIAAYGSVAFDGVYPGIDVLYHGAADFIEYDFRIAPGHDAKRVRIAFDAAGPIRIRPDGAVT
ncbi:MAG: hypothetical protein ACRD4P_00605, partial [Bryobacteraceae bacterium]